MTSASDDELKELLRAANRIVDEHRHEPDCLGGYPEYGPSDCTCGLYDLARAIGAVEDATEPTEAQATPLPPTTNPS
jgi:hypothetical protein